MTYLICGANFQLSWGAIPEIVRFNLCDIKIFVMCDVLFFYWFFLVFI